MHAFLTVALIHLLGVASPGPDFAIILQQGITQPRRVVVWTAFGLALGILVHVTYSLLGIGFIIAQSIVLFSLIKLLGAAYLLFIGWKAITAKRPHGSKEQHAEAMLKISAWQSIRLGFLCNALNPKATLFFLALFTQVIDPQTPLAIQVLYGLYMSFATFAWFAVLGSLLSARLIRRRIDAVNLVAERLMGAVLIALGLKVALSSRR
ncbi:LysE family translocator [Candidatus Peregrinibacteria bacterium]|nr:LysE family translocator [Candidatus Peregrinibacteria bacterium]